MTLRQFWNGNLETAVQRYAVSFRDQYPGIDKFTKGYVDFSSESL